MKSSVAVVPLASKLHPKDRVKDRLAQFEDLLKKSSVKVLMHDVVSSVDELKNEDLDADLNVVLFLTGGTSTLGYYSYLYLPHPKILLAHESDNSYPSALETLGRLKAKGIEAELHLTNMTSSTLLDKLEKFSLGGRAAKALRNSRLGLVDDFERSLLKSVGMRIVRIEIDELLERLREVEEGELSASLARLEKFDVAVSKERLIESLRLYQALRKLIELHNLTAVAINCFELVGKARVTPCLAAALLNDQGVQVVCEADLNAGLLMIALSSLAGVSWIGNLAYFDEFENVLTLAHCTAASKLSEGGSISLKSHFETNESVGLDVELKRGRVTLASIGAGGRLIATAGKVVASSLKNPNLCRTQVKVKLNVPVLRFIKECEANHHVIAYGDYVDALKALSWALGLAFKEV